MKLHAVAFVALAAVAFPAVAGAGKVYLEDSMPKVSSTQVTIKVRKPAAFKVLMRTSTQGRTKLFLLGDARAEGRPADRHEDLRLRRRGRLVLLQGELRAAAGGHVHVQGRLRRHDGAARAPRADGALVTPDAPSPRGTSETASPRSGRSCPNANDQSTGAPFQASRRSRSASGGLPEGDPLRDRSVTLFPQASSAPWRSRTRPLVHILPR